MKRNTTTGLLFVLLLCAACSSFQRLDNTRFKRTVAYSTSNACLYIDAQDVFDAIARIKARQQEAGHDSTQAEINQFRKLAMNDTFTVKENSGSNLQFYIEQVLRSKLSKGEVNVYDVKAGQTVKKIRVRHTREVGCKAVRFYNTENGNELWYYFYHCPPGRF